MRNSHSRYKHTLGIGTDTGRYEKKQLMATIDHNIFESDEYDEETCHATRIHDSKFCSSFVDPSTYDLNREDHIAIVINLKIHYDHSEAQIHDSKTVWRRAHNSA